MNGSRYVPLPIHIRNQDYQVQRGTIDG